MSKTRSEAQVVRGFKLIIEGLGLDVNSPHLKDTARRAAKAWYHELCQGITGKKPKITTFPATVNEMVILRGIPIRSLCSHHMLPFYGTATIGYIPGGGRILGLSKLSRVADYWSRRPQVQEELTAQIADQLAELVEVKTGKSMDKPGWPAIPDKGGVAVVIRATHMCMALRGVNHEGVMVTSALRGVFLTKPGVREEFMALTQEGK